MHSSPCCFCTRYVPKHERKWKPESDETIQLVDLTRSIQLGFFGLGVVMITVVSFVQVARSNRRKEHVS